MADQEFIAACGHKTTAKKLGQICPECFLNTHAELADLRAQLAAKDAEVAGLRDALAEAFRYLDEDGDTTRAYNALRAALKP